MEEREPARGSCLKKRLFFFKLVVTWACLNTETWFRVADRVSKHLLFLCLTNATKRTEKGYIKNCHLFHWKITGAQPFFCIKWIKSINVWPAERIRKFALSVEVALRHFAKWEKQALGRVRKLLGPSQAWEQTAETRVFFAAKQRSIKPRASQQEGKWAGGGAWLSRELRVCRWNFILRGWRRGCLPSGEDLTLFP